VSESDREQREAGVEAGEQGRPLRVGLVCGGPSGERGVSLNSARSVLDHIQVCGPHSRVCFASLVEFKY
jgi:hypothetical protein